MKHLPGEDSPHAHIRDQQRAAYFDAERHTARDEAGLPYPPRTPQPQPRPGEWAEHWVQGVHYDEIGGHR